MKRLNRKGFTLVELLAVIVILAIVVGITMATILPTIDRSRKEAFDVAVDAVKKYIQDQVDMRAVSGLLSGEEAYNAAVAEATKGTEETGDVLVKAGNYDTNITAIEWEVNTGTGLVTITCATANETGDYRQSETYTACTR